MAAFQLSSLAGPQTCASRPCPHSTPPAGFRRSPHDAGRQHGLLGLQPEVSLSRCGENHLAPLLWPAEDPSFPVLCLSAQKGTEQSLGEPQPTHSASFQDSPHPAGLLMPCIQEPASRPLPAQPVGWGSRTTRANSFPHSVAHGP